MLQQTPGGGKMAVTLRGQGAHTSSSEHLTIDQKAPSKLVVKPDGNILWEMPTDGPNAGSNWRRELLRIAQASVELTLLASGLCGTFMGAMVAVGELDRAKEQNYCVSAHQLTRLVAVTASSTAAGVAAGVVYAPLLAARILLGRVARPALVLGGIFALAKGALHLVAMRGNGPAQLLALLRGVGVEAEQVMEVLVKVATRAARNQGFRRAFIRMGGMDTLLRLLTSGPDTAMLKQLLDTLKQLLQEEAGQHAFVAGGGVPQMMHCLTHTSPEVVEGAAVVLGRIKDQPMAQQAMRECGGVPILASLMSPDSPASSSTRHQLLEVAGSLVRGDTAEEGAGELLEAGMLEVLVELMGPEPLPRTQVKESAISLLHQVSRVQPTALTSLVNHPSAFDALLGAQSAYGSQWYPCKADLHCLVALVGKAHAAATAGDAPVLVDLANM